MNKKQKGGEKKEKMKTKNKTLALMEIAIVLCSMFLVAIPAIAANQNQELQKASASVITTASEDDYVLGVYGNANEDDTIDMGDVVYTKLAIFGKKPKTELCDAKYDGRINVLDVIQTKLIILGKEKELTVVDSVDRTVTVPQPIERVVFLNCHVADAIRALGAEDKVVGIVGSVKDDPYFGEMCKKPSVARSSSTAVDYEAIAELHPQVVISFGGRALPDEEKLKPFNIAVVELTFNKPEIIQGELDKLGFILDKETEAQKLIEFYNKYEDMIRERVEDIGLEDRVQVYGEFLSYGGSYYTCSKKSGCGQAITLVGGKNLAEDLPGTWPMVDAEWVLDQNPEVVVKFVHPSADSEVFGYTVSSPTIVEERIKEVINRPGWEDHIDAVKNKRVYLCSWDITLDTPRNIVGVTYMAKWFYPEKFQDLDPEAVHKEYFEFIGMDYQGIWAYPPP